MFILVNRQAPDDYGPYTNTGNYDDHTAISLYSLCKDVCGDSVQILTEAPPSVSKFGRPYRSSYVSSNPYLIPYFKRVS